MHLNLPHTVIPTSYSNTYYAFKPTSSHSGMVHTAPVMKTHLLSTTGSDPHGFVVRKVPSSYHCRDNGLFFICILIADEDLTSAILMDQSVNLAGNVVTVYNDIIIMYVVIYY